MSPSNPVVRGKASRQAGDDQEARLFKLLRNHGVPRVSRPPGSGNGRRKGDVLVGDPGDEMAILFDAKTTLTTGEGAVVKITGSDLVKAASQAAGERRRPVLVPGISGLPPGVPEDWVILPASLLAELLAAYFERAVE